jgi:hypothetical protein
MRSLFTGASPDRFGDAGRARARARGALRIPFIYLTIALLPACGGGSDGPRSDGPIVPPPQSAFIVTADSPAGSFAILPLADPSSITLNVGPLHSDSVARQSGPLVYVVSRLGADSVQAIDPQDDFRTLWQCSVGNGSNPHDIAVVAPDKAYVTRFGSAELLIVNPDTTEDCAGFVRGAIDLAAFADGDGIPEMDQMAVVGERLYVALGRLSRNNSFEPTDRSLLAVVDVATGALVDVDPSTPDVDAIALTGTNPFSEAQPLTIDPATGKILVVEVGRFGVVGDGGIDVIDPVTNRAEGFLVSEADLGGNITDFELADEHRAYAIVTDADFTNSVVRFDPTAPSIASTLFVTQGYLADLEYSRDRDELYVADASIESPGIRVFRGQDGGEPVTRPIDTGLPPRGILLLQEGEQP